jgi:hypothetical protein
MHLDFALLKIMLVAIDFRLAVKVGLLLFTVARRKILRTC